MTAGLDGLNDEFTRQAERFNVWATKTDESSGERFLAALGDAAQGDILDTACGTGVVTAALAPRARSVTALDATAAMLAKARTRCEGLGNVSLVSGDAHNLPFAAAQFDGVICRLAVHHFANVYRAVTEMARVLKPGGVMAIADIVVSENEGDAHLQNAIETLRDPTHIAMLSVSQHVRLLETAGLNSVTTSTWSRPREFDEWMEIVNDETRRQPLRALVAALIDLGHDAGMQLRFDGDRIRFFHHWCMIAGHKPK